MILAFSVRLVQVASIVLLAASCSTKTSPTDSGNNSIQNDGYPYLRSAPTLEVDTFQDQLHHHWAQFNLTVPFTHNTHDFEFYIADHSFPVFSVPTVDGASVHGTDSVLTGNVAREDISPGDYYPIIYLETYNDVEPATFYYYDPEKSQQYYVYRKSSGTTWVDSGITNFRIPVVTVR